MHPQHCIYRENASALRASRGVHNNFQESNMILIIIICWPLQQIYSSTSHRTDNMGKQASASKEVQISAEKQKKERAKAPKVEDLGVTYVDSNRNIAVQLVRELSSKMYIVSSTGRCQGFECCGCKTNRSWGSSRKRVSWWYHLVFDICLSPIVYYRQARHFASRWAELTAGTRHSSSKHRTRMTATISPPTLCASSLEQFYQGQIFLSWLIRPLMDMRTFVVPGWSNLCFHAP